MRKMILTLAAVAAAVASASLSPRAAAPIRVMLLDGANNHDLIVVTYGKGRIFHTAEGHDVAAMSSIDFVTTLQRGTEWAATGKVTQKIPAAFPSERDAVVYRADLLRMDRNAGRQ